ncbi:hypothetical protein AcV7_005733 [Taiwanofungus camphoratus]|nr:hypothetical protein AcV7_005733 [Antrodia cinnamomea]
MSLNSQPSLNLAHSSFPSTELSTALAEQSFGLTNFTLTRISSLSATARITLLEGTALTISLSAMGYKIDHQEGTAIQAECLGEAKTFESLEGLLTAVSPRYEQARKDALFAKLQSLSDGT